MTWTDISRNSKGREVGPKGGNFWGGFPGGMSKIDELLTNNRFSVEQVVSYFTVTGLQNKYYC